MSASRGSGTFCPARSACSERHGGPGFRYQQLWRQFQRRERQPRRYIRHGCHCSEPGLLTDFRLGYYRYNVIDTKHDQGTNFADTLGIPGINIGGSITSGSPGFNVTEPAFGGKAAERTAVRFTGTGLNIHRCNCPLTEREDQFQVVNNWTKIIGNHSVKFGADLRYARNLRVLLPTTQIAPV